MTSESTSSSSAAVSLRPAPPPRCARRAAPALWSSPLMVVGRGRLRAGQQLVCHRPECLRSGRADRQSQDGQQAEPSSVDGRRRPGQDAALRRPDQTVRLPLHRRRGRAGRRRTRALACRRGWDRRAEPDLPPHPGPSWTSSMGAVPIASAARLVPSEYPEGTFPEKLTGGGRRLNERHLTASYRRVADSASDI